MENRKRDKEITALVLIDPNSDFISSFSCGRECSLLPLSLATRITLVKDATADYSDKEMHAALDVNIPNYASAMVTTVEIVDSISSL